MEFGLRCYRKTDRSVLRNSNTEHYLYFLLDKWIEWIEFFVMSIQTEKMLIEFDITLLIRDNRLGMGWAYLKAQDSDPI